MTKSPTQLAEMQTRTMKSLPFVLQIAVDVTGLQRSLFLIRISHHSLLFIYTYIPLSPKSFVSLVIKSITSYPVLILNPLSFFSCISLQNQPPYYNKSVTNCCPASKIFLCSSINAAINLLIINIANSLNALTCSPIHQMCKHYTNIFCPEIGID